MATSSDESATSGQNAAPAGYFRDIVTVLIVFSGIIAARSLPLDKLGGLGPMQSFVSLSVLPLIAIAMSVAGIVLVAFGLRGRPVFASPRCRRCGYDLRTIPFMSEEIGNCPECGASLAADDAVTFGKWRRQPRRIVTGIVILVLPWAALVPLVYYLNSRSRAAAIAAGMGGPQGMASLSTPALLASLPKNVSSPWAWQDLERRLNAGSLSNSDVDAALAVLSADLNAARAAGKRRQPLHWADRFITAAVTSGTVSKPAMDALCRAYYGPAPEAILRTTTRAGEPILVTLNRDDAWELPRMQRCWALTEIVVDGTTRLTAQDAYNRNQPLHADGLSGGRHQGEVRVALAHVLPPGVHELALTYELGVVSDQATFRGLDGKPGTPDKWPSPVARWQNVVLKKITIVPADQSLVTLLTDETKSPFKTSTLAVEQALARPSSRGIDIVLRWKASNPPSPLLSYRVSLQVGDEQFDAGTFIAGRTGRTVMLPGNSTARMKSLSPDVKAIDVILTPDAKGVEVHADIEEIWGKPLEIKGVTLERYDLEKIR